MLDDVPTLVVSDFDVNVVTVIDFENVESNIGNMVGAKAVIVGESEICAEF